MKQCKCEKLETMRQRYNETTSNDRTTKHWDNVTMNNETMGQGCNEALDQRSNATNKKWNVETIRHRVNETMKHLDKGSMRRMKQWKVGQQLHGTLEKWNYGTTNE